MTSLACVTNETGTQDGGNGMFSNQELQEREIRKNGL